MSSAAVITAKPIHFKDKIVVAGAWTHSCDMNNKVDFKASGATIKSKKYVKKETYDILRCTLNSYNKI